MITDVGSRLSRVPILAEIEWRDQGGESTATAFGPTFHAVLDLIADNGIRIDITIPDLVESLPGWLEESGRGRRGPDDFDID